MRPRAPSRPGRRDQGATWWALVVAVGVLAAAVSTVAIVADRDRDPGAAVLPFLPSATTPPATTTAPPVIPTTAVVVPGSSDPDATLPASVVGRWEGTWTATTNTANDGVEIGAGQARWLDVSIAPASPYPTASGQIMLHPWTTGIVPFAAFPIATTAPEGVQFTVVHVYGDTDRSAVVVTFRGHLVGDRLEGTVMGNHLLTGTTFTGTWSVTRTA